MSLQSPCSHCTNACPQRARNNACPLAISIGYSPFIRASQVPPSIPASSQAHLSFFPGPLTHRGKPLYAEAPVLLAPAPAPGPGLAEAAAAAAAAAEEPEPEAGGPRRMRSARPRSFQAGSRRPRWVARWMPKAACWSGTTSSSSSGFTGRCCAATYTSSSGSRSRQKSSNWSASRPARRCRYVKLLSLLCGVDC